MADIGGHGGASHSEIWTAGLVMSDELDKSSLSDTSLPSTFTKLVDRILRIFKILFCLASYLI